MRRAGRSNRQPRFCPASQCCCSPSMPRQRAAARTSDRHGRSHDFGQLAAIGCLRAELQMADGAWRSRCSRCPNHPKGVWHVQRCGGVHQGSLAPHAQPSDVPQLRDRFAEFGEGDQLQVRKRTRSTVVALHHFLGEMARSIADPSGVFAGTPSPGHERRAQVVEPQRHDVLGALEQYRSRDASELKITAKCCGFLCRSAAEVGNDGLFPCGHS